MLEQSYSSKILSHFFTDPWQPKGKALELTLTPKAEAEAKIVARERAANFMVYYLIESSSKLDCRASPNRPSSCHKGGGIEHQHFSHLPKKG